MLPVALFVPFLYEVNAGLVLATGWFWRTYRTGLCCSNGLGQFSLPHTQVAKRALSYHRQDCESTNQGGHARRLQVSHQRRDGTNETTGTVAEDRVSGCRHQPARRAGGDVHHQSSAAHAFAHALSLHHQRDREPQWCGATLTQRVSHYRDTEWRCAGQPPASWKQRSHSVRSRASEDLWVLATALGRNDMRFDETKKVA